MNQKTRYITHGAIIGAMYFALTHLQNIILPNSASWAIQCRLAESLCVLAFFTPAAAPGLAIGCLLFNLSFAGALPLDFLVGSLATFGACGCMWLSRNWTVRGYPLVGMLMPAVWNAVLVGWELTVYIGDTGFTMAAFWLNALLVALGELIVLGTLGSSVYHILRRGMLGKRIFG